jgi:hypothetical protein
VWQELQPPSVCMSVIAREAPALLVSFTLYGVLMVVVL